MKFSTEELRPLEIFENMSQNLLEWICDHGTKIDLAINEHMFEPGQAADYLFIVVSGTIKRYEEIGGQWLVVATTKRGQVTGMLPFSRMTQYPGPAMAAEPSVVIRIDKNDFDDLLSVSHEFGQRLVAEMSNRVRHDIRREQQREKLVSLGRLSAGLAHELNNPAAVIRSTSASLAERLLNNTILITKIVKHGLDGSSIEVIEKLWRMAHEKGPPKMTPLQRSEREEEFINWLDEHEIDDNQNLSGVFTDSGLDISHLNHFAEVVPQSFFVDALIWVAGNIEVNRMVNEITSSATRVSELISSVKIYSHMDQSSEQRPVDVREGLDNTLKMFGHKINSKKIMITQDYRDDLPEINGNAGELNQVWTILIENAIDAMSEGGQLTIEVGYNDLEIVVKIIDSGGGISKDISDRIFDPFFTTKGVGEGMGLGLDIARRIVNMHRGQIVVSSEPGRTEMCVELPKTLTENSL